MLAAASLYGKACITLHLICKFWQKFCTLAKGSHTDVFLGQGWAQGVNVADMLNQKVDSIF
jgi:hypothetical protein